MIAVIIAFPFEISSKYTVIKIKKNKQFLIKLQKV